MTDLTAPAHPIHAGVSDAGATARTAAARRRRRRGKPNPLTYVGLVAASLFAIIPLLWGLSTSFKSESATLSDSGWIPAQFTFENYRLVLFESKIPVYLGNTLLVAGLTVVATIIVAIFGAYAAARFRFRGKTASMFLILMTSMIPGIAILVPLYFIAVNLGLYDSYAIMVIVYTAWQIPTVIWMLKGFFESIPDSIEEAGRVDGASHWRVMTKLIFPLAVPGVAAAAVISFIYVWNDFLIASTLISTDERRLVAVGLYNYLSQYGVVWGQLTAAVVVTVIPIILVFVLMERRIVAGLSAGATKG
ncbi:carbohydrate ABC transporter permease [Herbiconiux sp. L3-i23]|uniref:carbohydrate ABC transporter permease n=1 Tax=Herbiconiux sp. L3-i23 TaxID=2905871 RepID=UPI00206D007C|nr:carbohydrate ABC transporter permease [Herbiconiux sp. L3-i23]BDI22096.1 sugar ABC transporter permease [Herbiconiux sp. L3-i23]